MDIYIALVSNVCDIVNYCSCCCNHLKMIKLSNCSAGTRSCGQGRRQTVMSHVYYKVMVLVNEYL